MNINMLNEMRLRTGVVSSVIVFGVFLSSLGTISPLIQQNLENKTNERKTIYYYFSKIRSSHLSFDDTLERSSATCMFV